MFRLPRLPFLILAIAGLGAFVGGADCRQRHASRRLPPVHTATHALPAGACCGWWDWPWRQNPCPPESRRFLATTSAATGLWIASYQTWLQHPPKVPAARPTRPGRGSVYWAGQQAPDFPLQRHVFRPSFTLFGLTIANYSILMFLFLGTVALFAVARRGGEFYLPLISPGRSKIERVVSDKAGKHPESVRALGHNQNAESRRRAKLSRIPEPYPLDTNRVPTPDDRTSPLQTRRPDAHRRQRQAAARHA